MLYRGVLVSVLALGLFALSAWYSGSRDPVNEVMTAEARTGRVLRSAPVDIGNDIVLHVVSAGPRDGPPVLLLHGFPGFWFSWYKQIDALASAGYHVIVPDLPGFNRSRDPGAGDSFTLKACADDMVALMDRLSISSAYIAGHDLGSGVALTLIKEYPDRVRRAILFNGVAPVAPAALRTRYTKPLLSYPVFTELFARTGDWWLLARYLTNNASTATFSHEDLNIYKSAWAQSRAITSVLTRSSAADDEDGDKQDGGGGRVLLQTPAVPVLAYVGGDDKLATAAQIEQAAPFLNAKTIVVVPGVGHWLPLEDPKTTNFALESFFR